MSMKTLVPLFACAALLSACDPHAQKADENNETSDPDAAPGTTGETPASAGGTPGDTPADSGTTTPSTEPSQTNPPPPSGG
jgi:hypothetical protein